LSVSAPVALVCPMISKHALLRATRLAMCFNHIE
jgi:hypothetical protein